MEDISGPRAVRLQIADLLLPNFFLRPRRRLSLVLRREAHMLGHFFYQLPHCRTPAWSGGKNVEDCHSDFVFGDARHSCSVSHGGQNIGCAVAVFSQCYLPLCVFCELFLKGGWLCRPHCGPNSSPVHPQLIAKTSPRHPQDIPRIILKSEPVVPSFHLLSFWFVITPKSKVNRQIRRRVPGEASFGSSFRPRDHWRRCQWLRHRARRSGAGEYRFSL